MRMQAFPRPRSGPDDIGVGGLALLAISTAAEICEAVPENQARGFFLSLGKRMAALEPLEGVTDVGSLTASVNAFWKALDWGHVQIEAGERGFTVLHDDLPNRIAPDPHGHWHTMLCAVLEGAYDSWFRILGSGPALTTRAKWQGDTLELHHGR